jgi:hypothetical protein
MQNGSNPTVLQGRQRLVFSLQTAYSLRRFDSPGLQAAVGDFVWSARHRGLDLKWVLDAVQDAIDAGVMPALSESQRRAFSGAVRHIAEEAYTHCHEEIAPRTLAEWLRAPA